ADLAALRHAQGHKKAIHDVFRHFSESDMAALDARIPEDEWYIDEERVAYVRMNRNAFRSTAISDRSP
ncbi:MAG TPA: hypothetical protein VGJ20_38990, partial [Xanthobacteraceae bacterium]